MASAHEDDPAKVGFDARAAAAVLGFLLWIASLFTPAVTECPGEQTVAGWDLLAFGAFGPAAGQFGWYANPFMLWTMVRLTSNTRPIVSASIGFFLAATAFFWVEDHGLDHTIRQICRHDIGFYLWLSCAGLLAIATFVPRQRSAGADVDSR